MEKNRSIMKGRWLFENVLGSSLDHYDTVMPEEWGGLSGALLRIFFSRVRIPEEVREKLKAFESQGRVIHTVLHRSGMDFLFFNYRFSRMGLRAPRISVNLPIGWYLPLRKRIQVILNKLLRSLNSLEPPEKTLWSYYFEMLKEPSNGMLIYLVNPLELERRLFEPEFDPFYQLILRFKKDNVELIFVPLFVVFGRAPEQEEKGLLDIFFGPQEQPGRFRRVVQYLRFSGEAFVELGDPVFLSKFLERSENQGLKESELGYRLREHLIGHLEREKKVIFGPRLKARSRIIEEVLRDEVLEKELEEIARSQSRSLLDVQREAFSYLQEMAADYDQNMVEFLAGIVRWAFNNFYDGIEVDEEELERVREVAKRYPVVYVPSHKSHIDYLALNYVLVIKNFVCPHIVAGINLNFFPVGTIFRGCGAFFMRRSFKGNRVYAEVFSKYLKILLKEGYNIEFFIEGGRSRTGRLLEPKLGVMKYILEAFNELKLRDIYFVPVYIGYDQILEEDEYLAEMRGEKKGLSGTLSELRARHLLQKRYGKIYIKFAKPISLRSYLGMFSSDSSRFLEESESYKGFGDLIVEQINNISVVTPFSLVATGLLASSRSGLREREAWENFRIFYDYLKKQGVYLAGSFSNFEMAIKEALELYQRRKLLEIELDELSGESIFFVFPEKRSLLEMYKNHIIHFLISASFVATCLIEQNGEEVDFKRLEKDYLFWKELFSKEFVYRNLKIEEELKEAVTYFQNLSDKGNGIQKDKALFLNEHTFKKNLYRFSGITLNFFESYLVIFKNLESFKDRTFTEKEFIERAVIVGQRLWRLSEISRREAISRFNFQNSFRFIVSSELIEGKGESYKLSLRSREKINDYIYRIHNVLERLKGY